MGNKTYTEAEIERLSEEYHKMLREATNIYSSSPTNPTNSTTVFKRRKYTARHLSTEALQYIIDNPDKRYWHPYWVEIVEEELLSREVDKILLEEEI